MTNVLLDTLSDAARPRDPAWLSGLRAGASSALRERGLPGKKHEGWRFTSVRELVDTPFRPATGGADEAREEAAVGKANARLADDPAWKVLVVDGRPRLLGEPPAGVRVSSLAAALEAEPALVQPVLGQLAPQEHFSALNSAMFDDGLLIEISAGAAVDGPVHVVHVASGHASQPTASYPRLVIIGRASSQATLLETFLDGAPEGAAHLTNTVAEVHLEANARLDHIRVTEGSERMAHLGQLAVRLERDAFYGSRVVALGGKLTRLNLGVRFDGPGAEVELDGVYHVHQREHVDHQIRVTHASGHCTSHVRYRGLLDGHGHAVFNAMGIVERDAQGSEVHQENRNLLLSDDATIDTKPHLEIDADDIRASHGAAIGALDAQQLFYMRARGIAEGPARDLLTFAFVRELLDRIPHGPVISRASDSILGRLPQGDALREAVARPDANGGRA